MRERVITFLVGLLIGLLAGVCCGATPAQATAIATDYARQVGPVAASQSFFLWSPTESDEEFVALNIALNSISRTTVDVHAAKLPGCGFVFRWSDLARDEQDAKEILHLLNLICFNENIFHGPEQLGGLVGYGDRTRWAAPANHLGARGPALQQATNRVTIPLVDARRFIAAALSSIEVQGVEGFYYQFLGVEPGRTTLEGYLEGVGASLAEARKLLAAEHALIRRSNVTGKERAIVAWRSQGVRPSVGTGLVSITLDLSDDSVTNERKSFARNLLIETADGSELINETASGWLAYTLWNAEGQLVAEVPPEIAADHTIPAPHTRRLQSAISCLRCHGSDEGWKQFQSWLPESDRLSIVGDASGNFDPGNITELQSRYGGDLSLAFRLGRDSYASRIFAVTRQDDPANAHQAVANVYEKYIFAPVTAADVLAETGATSLDVFAGLADPLVEALAQGLGVGRGEYEKIAGALHEAAQ